MKILVPVRYPLTKNSKSTIAHALEMKEEAGAEDGEAELVILHVNLFQENGRVSRKELRREVESEFGIGEASYVIRRGFLVEETILSEAASQGADVIVIGRTRSGKLRRALRRLVGNDPDVEGFLRQNLDVRIEVAG
ncbi:MAG: universal stress protein [Halobacteriales archaeon]|nr:universal stress protein [Halobacteriales archaeon]